MEVRTSYKQTQYGPVPSDWEMKPLWKLSSFITKGSTPTTYGYDWVSDGIRFLRSECVAEHGLDLKESMFISEEAHSVLSRSAVQSGDLLITITGNVGRTILLGEDFGVGNINQHIARVRITDSQLDRKFVLHFLSQPRVREYYKSITTGQAYPQISLKQVRETEIPVPPLPEQRAIADALSDVDALIERLDALIAKKRAIKTAAMQRLLTGEQRLPGFDGTWTTKRLGDIAETSTGKKDNQDKVDGGPYPFFVRSQNVERIDTFSFDGEAILVPGEGRIGDIFHYVNGKFDYHQRVYKVSDFSADVSGKYVYYYMSQHFGEHAMRNSVKATVDSLRLPTFEKFEVHTPPLKEQQAIAKVLTDMDVEIEALQARCDKTQAIKQGMMQELLTGRTRLV